MANSILTPTAVTREALRILHQKLNFVGNIVREYDDSFAKKGARIGDTLKIRLPNQYSVRTGATLTTQDTNETSVSLTVGTQKGVDLNFTSVDLTLSLDDFSDRILQPAMTVLAANIEADSLSMYKDVANSVWNGGSAATLAKVLQGRKLLQDHLAPLNDRTALLNTQDNVDIVTDVKGLFNAQDTISKQYKEGYVGRTAGFDFAENTLIPAHLRGAGNTAYTTNTTGLATDGTEYAAITVATGTGTLKKGDVITIAGIDRCHPESKADQGALRQFVVTADYAGGGGSVSISPSIFLGGPKQNCVAATTSTTAAVAIAGTASTAVGTSLMFQKEAFAFATADLVMPQGVDFASRQVLDGVSMRIVRAYDINNDKFPCRIDVLYGYKTLRASLACRLHNN
ncbi:MAG TPA: P22 phage major capsid protein family protein [Allosphingosinicella sp.]|nr:P22 phage major capsid protein family protein [Allosphingosinicella sp.]